MKALFLMVVAGLALTASPAVRAADLQYWADESTHKLYFVYRPFVDVQVINIGADDDVWDEVAIDVNYSNPQMDGYLNQLKARYPGYEINRTPMDRQGDFRLTIPVLGVDETVPAMPGQVGPYMHWQAFVSKAKSDLVRRAIAQPGAISITGNASVTYREMKTLERVELGSEICQELASREGTLYGVITGYRKVMSEIDARSFRYPGTKAALMRSVLESCLTLPQDGRSGSFGALLDIAVELRRNPVRPFGETRGEVPNSTVVPLQMDMSVNVGNRS